jgi:hypothetical protein
MDKTWYSSDGKIISCTEKIKVMQQNIDELRQLAQDAFEDGVLMGVDPNQLRECFASLMKKLDNSYPNKK